MKFSYILLVVAVTPLYYMLFVGVRTHLQKSHNAQVDSGGACQAQFSIEPQRPATATMKKSGGMYYWDIDINYIGDNQNALYFYAKSNPPTNELLMLEPGASVSLKSSASHGPFTLQSAYSWSLYRTDRKIQANVLYPVNTLSKVTQDWRGTIGGRRHSGETINAVDIEIPLGTEILAPIDGFIEFVESRYPDTACMSMNAATLGNDIVIHSRHGYDLRLAHLKQNSPRVQVGQHVFAGDVIARSGASGASYKPHLHIQAEALSANGLITVPISFHTNQGKPIEYQLGQFICLTCPQSARQ